MTILITGTTGTISSAVLKGLAGTDHPPLRALVRDPARAAGLSDTIEIVQGDLDQPGTLDAAFEGVDTLWLLTPMGAVAPHSTSNALWAARHAGVSHVVRVSAVGAGHEAPTRNGRLHALSELELRAADFDWTIIRPGYLMQNLFGSLVGDTLYGGIGDGRVGMIDAADIGAFGARVLADPAAHASKVYTITGPETIGLRDMADEIAEVTGTPVMYQPLTFEQLHQVMLDAGLPAWDAAVNTEYARAYSGGWGDFTTEDFPKLMGRPARDAAAFVRENLTGLRGR